jgi:hypothetical protein
MIDRAPVRPSLLADLEDRQEDVLKQLDELNHRIEQAVSQSRSPAAILDGRSDAD